MIKNTQPIALLEARHEEEIRLANELHHTRMLCMAKRHREEVMLLALQSKEKVFVSSVVSLLREPLEACASAPGSIEYEDARAMLNLLSRVLEEKDII